LNVLDLQRYRSTSIRRALAFAKCKTSGIESIMATGDNPFKAQVIAYKVGFLTKIELELPM